MYNLTQPIVVGVIVFALSQYFLKLILEPIIQFRKLLSDISHTILFNQAAILSGETKKTLHQNISELSAKLRSSVYLIPFYTFLCKLKLFGLPRKENVLLACRKLNILSYGVLNDIQEVSEVAQRNEKILKDISKLLSIETTYMMKEE